jgi:hypothetical protein
MLPKWSNIRAYFRAKLTPPPSPRVTTVEVKRKEARLELERAIDDLARARARNSTHGTA